MVRKERLPAGFWRSPSKAIRVQVRATGHKTETRTFPLFHDAPAERKRQRDEAEAWAAETRRRMHAGVHVSTREAEKLTLGEALRRYERAKLDPENPNNRKEMTRIAQILADDIADRPIAALREVDIATYRDLLLRRGWLKNVDNVCERLDKVGEDASRVREISSLPKLRSERDLEEDPVKRKALDKKLSAICEREGIKSLASTTISNKIQLISRAMKFVGETIPGVPVLGPVAMPEKSQGRDRRLRDGEMTDLQKGAVAIGGVLPLAISLAVETALRRDRVLTLAPEHLHDIGGNRLVIRFPRVPGRKRVGIVPVTREILALLNSAAVLQGAASWTDCDPKKPFLAINETTLAHQWRALVLSIGSDDLTFHDLRHEGTSRLFERGLTTAQVMSITGHSTSEMVDRYSHYSSSIVHDRMTTKQNAETIYEEIEFLINQYVSADGNMRRLEALISARL